MTSFANKAQRRSEVALRVENLLRLGFEFLDKGQIQQSMASFEGAVFSSKNQVCKTMKIVP